MAAVPRPGFNRRTREPRLTKRLKIYVENYVAHDRGLLGMWAAEDIIGDIDRETGELVEERRTDIVYGWNDAASKFELVFDSSACGKESRTGTSISASMGSPAS